jgi:hypothetical protein
LFFFARPDAHRKVPKKKQIGETGKKVGRVDLPPLKIGIVDCDELTESIQTRWQEFSEQQIELIKLERGKINNTEIPSLDVILYPAHFLGTIAETDWIAPVPTPLLQRLGVGSRPGKSNQEVSENLETGIENWSSRWGAHSPWEVHVGSQQPAVSMWNP